MNNLHIEPVHGVYKSPEVRMDAQTGLCEITGDSYIEDTWGFYQPIIDWIAQYTHRIGNTLDITFKINYYNTSSSRVFQDILKVIKDYSLQQPNIKITWYYDPDDDSTLEDGEDFKRYLGLDMMELVPFGY